MEQPSTSEIADFRREYIEKLSVHQVALDNNVLTMAECAAVLRLLTFGVILDCPDDTLANRIADSAGDWWKSGPSGGQISKILAIVQGTEARDPVFEDRVRRELRETVARALNVLREI